ncbi:MAG TPA: COX15/CtaA family protein [Gemmatimonadaceae bacterium]|nr:COX15/CtaA family protein [Gemmatimonadaceae bacterium]
MTLRRLSTVAVVVTYLHLVFGGIVRISGSGMGCGDNWPLCNGAVVPDLSNPIVAIELTHRLLATLVILTIAALTWTAYRRRDETGVSGPGGVLRAATTALVLVVAVALLGMVTVKLGNRPIATVAHWTLALTLLGVVLATAARAGAFGGDAARVHGGSARAARSLGAGAAMAFLAVVLGGLVAKFPDAAVACRSFPLCGDHAPNLAAGAAHLQMTHRIVAYVLFFHVLGIGMAIGRRATEAAGVKRAARAAMLLVLLQLGLGAAMVMAMLPPVLRSLHQAVGILVWMTLFLGTYLARLASGSTQATREVIAPREAVRA